MLFEYKTTPIDRIEATLFNFYSYRSHTILKLSNETRALSLEIHFISI